MLQSLDAVGVASGCKGDAMTGSLLQDLSQVGRTRVPRSTRQLQ
jgi:hypothetical protein